ncbi:MAG: cobalt transporter CbiM [Actinobacteria bacterium]|nr:cobalt transporter CbiM [Actinomycetota bacterium]MCG2803254.1 cobalt transporter CbiM [Cellulomonas sp.]
MHIPDGYLSPATCVVTAAAAVPLLVVASRKVTEVVKTKDVPLLAMFSAVSFLVMMFNVPIPDGTTAHAVGAVVIAIVLGPWAAVIAVTVALLFQALLFGDGGVLTLGANVLNMAVIMPFVGVWAYRAVAGRAPLTSRRRLVAAGIGGYVGINAAGLATAIELGLQPLLAHTADGTPLYSPYTLAQTIPAMALAHLTIAGAAETILTVGVLGYLARTEVSRLVAAHPGIPVTADDVTPTTPARPHRLRPGAVAIGFVVAMVALVPLGLLAPGGAFGEDAPGDLDLPSLGLSAVPAGLNRFSGFWSHTLLGDYGFADGQNAVLGYWVSALVGIAVIGAAIWLLGRALAALGARRGTGDGRRDTPVDAPAAT